MPAIQKNTVIAITTIFIAIHGIFPPVAAPRDRLILRFLIWEGYAPYQQQQAFKQKILTKHGVELEFAVRYASNPDHFFNELRKGEVDIISPAHNLPKDSRYNFTTNGLTLPINIKNVPNYHNIAPALKEQHWAVEDGKIYAVPIIQGPYALAYNTAIVKEEPDSWNVFWVERYAGRYSVQKDYYELNVYIAALALGFCSEEIFHYDVIKGPALENKIQQLAIHADSLWTGFDKPIHFKGKALATSWRITFPKINRLGESWRIAVPVEGTTWWIDTLALSHTLKDDPLLKQIAEEWINFMLEPQIQTDALALKLGVYPVTTPALTLFSPKKKNQ
ncbi:MAG: extracellular solute-binding protein, partial [Deltaproteobacteria bacterium]|nr:extracellular solute-binding protein [Deltaproteobacteria bacterium]